MRRPFRRLLGAAALRIPQAYVFHEIGQEVYDACFEKYLLRDSSTALVLEVDGSSHILRASLGDMLREVS
jgi:hypothetical protein